MQEIEMADRIEELRKSFRQEIARIDTPEELEKLRIKYLGRKGLFMEIFKAISSFPAEQRPKAGELANRVRNDAFSEWNKKKKEIELKREKVKEEKKAIDVTLPGKKISLGKKHPITLTMDEIKNIFVSLGFRIVDGPEVETEYYNFEALKGRGAFTHSYFSSSDSGYGEASSSFSYYCPWQMLPPRCNRCFSFADVPPGGGTSG
jgi:phenylalanyl-tRNA synthetase alpha chain